MSENHWAAERGAKWSANTCGMEAMLAPVDGPLIRALQFDTPCRIADIGCGGGGGALEILRAAPAGSMVHGFDISPASIETARARVDSVQRGIAFEIADVTTAPLPEALYDRLVSRFGIMFFDDPEAAFATLIQWLAPGGRFAFAVWGEPTENPWMTSVRQVVAQIIDLPIVDTNAPGPFRYADADHLLTLLDGAGFSELEIIDWRGALPIGGRLSAAQAAAFALASFSSFGELLAAAGGEALNDARRSLSKYYSQQEKDGAVLMDACVHIVSGAGLV